MIFKRFLIDKIQDKNKVFQRQISNELKVKVKVKRNQNNVNTISYNQRRKKFDIFLETKIIWAFMPESGFGMDSQKLYANGSQRITIPKVYAPILSLRSKGSKFRPV